ncbi:unnamed protein product [Ceratitis capitata]|uniref:(Mediterranean fruit fly) hypothetical protein n=1 Tax=Ceratitis capitata TaxID=7213 RepID=A0A811V5J1_CERCA|nr:unnamed protein product [Ceratitis capitata]
MYVDDVLSGGHDIESTIPVRIEINQIKTRKKKEQIIFKEKQAGGLNYVEIGFKMKDSEHIICQLKITEEQQQ